MQQMDPDRQANILIVDDEPSNLLALEATLECLGQRICKASSGVDALRQLLDQDFAVILLDVQMPGMDGIETASLIRERERSRQVPIIFLTGVVKTAEMMFKGYSAGAVDYLMKPIVSGVLRAKVEVFVELALARQALQQQIAERARVAAEIAKLNMELEQRNEDLVAVNADLETFSHSVSHDLRTPLRHVQGYIALLADSLNEKLNDEQRRYMGVVKDGARRMNKLIDDLLEFSRTGRVSLSKSLVDMNALVAETIAELAPDLTNRKFEWAVAPIESVWGDANLLKQVWMNLLTNAVKYTRTREVARICVQSIKQDKELIFQVSDNGVGFPMAHADKLFGVFQRLHLATQFEGTGVGLANVRRIVQRHSGRTWAQSIEGEGADFYFSLPARTLEELLGPDATPPQAAEQERT
jgi:signal transduction histidine kinase